MFNLHKSNVDKQTKPSGTWFPPLLLGFAAIFGGIITIREPLWIDELHTYWASSGAWTDVVSRARFGNQSPLWFWIEHLSLATLVSKDSTPLAHQIALRLPSLLCWFTAFAFIGRLLSRQSHGLTLCGLSGVLLFCDQINWFYAVEARPYAGVALCMVIAAISQMRLLRCSSTLQRFIYITSATIAVYLHYTAWIFVVALFIACLIRAIATQESNSIKRCVVDFGFVLLLIIPALVDLVQIGANQNLWQSFASNTSFWNVRTLLPIDAWFLVALLIWYIDSKRDQSSFNKDESIVAAMTIMLSVIISISAIWVMAGLKLAPLIHTRYIISGYPMILLATMLVLSRIRKTWLLYNAIIVMACAWMWSQGGPSWIRYGQAVVWQRQEDWPAVVQTVESELGEQTDALLAFAPMLVETRDRVSIDQFGEKELMYGWQAARTLYGSKISIVQPSLLLTNETERWSEAIVPAVSDSKTSVILLVCRSPAFRVMPTLERIASQNSDLLEKPQLLFGNASQRMSVFRIQRK